jgi:UDP-N-acetylmuramate--alanine ligase
VPEPDARTVLDPTSAVLDPTSAVLDPSSAVLDPSSAVLEPSSAVLDLSRPRSIHIVGVGGAGMSAIATVLVQMGHTVSGSDLRESRALERLALLDVTTHVGHAAEHLPGKLDAVVISTAIPRRNPEVEAAVARGVPVLRRADALRAIVATRKTVAVAGSHGKTTTSSMLALIMRAAGWHPSFLIGGDLNEVGTNAVFDSGEWLVVEADESDGTFLELAPHDAVVTSILPDHLDHYGDFATLVRSFADFVDAVPGVCALGIDDEVTAGLAAARSDAVVTYGFAPGADYAMSAYQGGRAGTQFVLSRRGEELGPVALPVAGRHNAVNAAGAAAIALELGVPFDAVTRAIGGFGGVARRFQFRGELDGVTYVDDYAHLPSDVDAMIQAAREGGWNRVVAVFQPHRYSRTAALWREFADAFTGADEVVLTDVYPAGERPQPGVSGRLVLRAVLDAHPEQAVVYLPRHADLVAHVPRRARRGDIVLTLGAGDLTTAVDEWLGAPGS